jgi:hypothetical protein
MYTLGTAARAFGVSKSTIHRAIKRGAISARSKDGNGCEIDPAELHRVFPLAPEKVAHNGSGEGAAERLATAHEVERRLARAEAEIEGLKRIAEMERNRAEELRQERDNWRAISEHLALPKPAAVAPRIPAGQAQRSWWPWRPTG